MKNERGFFLPLTVVTVMVLLFFCMHQLNLYITEKKFYMEREETYILDNMMRNTVIQVKERITVDKERSWEELFSYEEGEAFAKVVLESPSLFYVRIDAKTVRNREYVVQFKYDVATDTMFNWAE